MHISPKITNFTENNLGKMKKYTKELIVYAIVAFVIGEVIMLGSLMFVNHTVTWWSVLGNVVGASLFATLMTLFKYITDKKKKNGR